MVELTVADLDMGRFLKFNGGAHRTPRRFWSNSIDSNKA